MSRPPAIDPLSPTWLTGEVMDHFVVEIIDGGHGVCEGCELPLTDSDDDHVVTCCQDPVCHQIRIWHPNCAPGWARTEAGVTHRRINWRWN